MDINIWHVMAVSVICTGIKIWMAYRDYKKAIADYQTERTHTIVVTPYREPEIVTEDAEFEVVQPKQISL